MHEVLHCNGSRLSGLGEIASDLRAPGHVRRAVGDATDEDPPSVELDEEQDVQCLQPDRLDSEQVTGDDRGRLGPHELTPGLPLWSGARLGREDPPDRGRRDFDADLCEFSLDPSVAPGQVLARHSPNDELGLEADRPARDDAMRVVPLAAHKLSVPATKRVRSHEKGQSLADGPEPLEHREDDPLFGADLRTRVLASEPVEFLTQDEDLDVLRA